MTINIAGLEKAKVLIALYEHVRVQGIPFMTGITVPPPQ